ncbi:MAG: GerMN domain-containing protein [Clostridiales bacterium]|nr:GerMN domain-containing protein [Clostridiales bacterium]
MRIIKVLYLTMTFIVLLLSFSCALPRTMVPISGFTSLQVYYAHTEENRNKGKLIGKMDLQVPTDVDLLAEALSRILENPDDNSYISAFPTNVKIIDFTLSDGNVRVSMTNNYKNMPALDKIIAQSCLTLTLCALKEVDTVSIYAEGVLLEKNLSADDILLPETEKSEYEQQITVCFADENNSFLEQERRYLTIGKDKLLSEYVVDEIIRGPQNDNLHSAIPEGTRVLSVTMKRNLCTVDLSKEFYVNRPQTAAGERVAIYSIVNSLTSLSGIEAVQITVEGEKLDKYYLINLNEPLTRNESIIWRPSSDSTLSIITVYMGVGSGKIVALPRIVEMDYNVSIEQNVIEQMLSVKSSFGYYPLIQTGTRLISASTVSRVCTIDLSSEFLVEGNNMRVDLAVKALAAAVIDSGNADFVVISVEGSKLNNGLKIGKDSSVILY